MSTNENKPSKRPRRRRGNFDVDRIFARRRSWMRFADEHDVVISSRIRLARNIKGKVFPERCDAAQRLELWRELGELLPQVKSLEGAVRLAMIELSELDKVYLLERHLISRDLLEDEPGSGLVAQPDGQVSAMINEEDHLRLQIIMPGLNLEKAWENASRLDDEISELVEYAFSPRLGFLTACPTNVGTGLRTSVMLHLPGLVLSDEMEPIVRGLTKIGLAVRGLLGEGSEAVGNIFQISNQVTLGESEEEIIKSISQIVREVVEHELNARQRLLEKKELVLVDHLGRAFGVLANARLLTTKEALDFLSSLRLGRLLGIFQGVELDDLRTLMEVSQPAHLQKRVGRRLSSRQRDFHRARLVREVLKDKGEIVEPGPLGAEDGER